VRHKTHWLWGEAAACNYPTPERLTHQRNRVDCKNCLRTWKWKARTPQPAWSGPLEPAIRLALRNRTVWSDVTHTGTWVVALCDGRPGEVFTEWGISSSAEMALRIALAQYLTPEQEEWLMERELSGGRSW